MSTGDGAPRTTTWRIGTITVGLDWDAREVEGVVIGTITRKLGLGRA